MTPTEYGDLVVAEARTWRGTPYRLGGWSRMGIDCRGLIHRVLKALGLTATMDSPQGNVRQFYRSAVERGFWRPMESGFRPFPGCAVIYAEDIEGPEPGNPHHIRHIAFVFRVGKHYSAHSPRGWAFSALNPAEGTHGHPLSLNPGRLKIFGYIEPDLSLAEPDPPSGDPEPPVE